MTGKNELFLMKKKPPRAQTFIRFIRKSEQQRIVLEIVGVFS